MTNLSGALLGRGLKQQWIDCPKCNGRGTVPHPTQWREGREVNCPVCKGGGRIKE